MYEVVELNANIYIYIRTTLTMYTCMVDKQAKLCGRLERTYFPETFLLTWVIMLL